MLSGLHSTYIINSRNLWRCKFCVIAPTTGGMDPTASNSFFQNCIIDGKVKDFINLSTLLFQHLIKLNKTFDETVRKDYVSKHSFTVYIL